jgi:hypothetical protein
MTKKKTVLIGGVPCAGVEWMGRIFHTTSGVVVNRNTAVASATAKEYALNPSPEVLSRLATAQEIARNQIVATNLYVHADPWNLWSAGDLIASGSIEDLRVVILSRPCAEVVAWSQGDARVSPPLSGKIKAPGRVLGYENPGVRPEVAANYASLDYDERMVLWWAAHEHEVSRLLALGEPITSQLIVVSYDDLHRDPFGTLWDLRCRIGMQSQFPMINPEERRVPGEEFCRKIAAIKARLFLDD